MGTRHTVQAVLKKVVANAGGMRAAADQLDIPAALLARFLEGAPVPDAILLRAVDLILEEPSGSASAGGALRSATSDRATGGG